MADVVNLRQFRKAKARTEKRKRAEDNRAKHGLTKAQRQLAEKQNTLDRTRLDGKNTKTDDD